MLYVYPKYYKNSNECFVLFWGKLGCQGSTYFGSKLARALETCVPEHKDSSIVTGMYNFEKTQNATSEMIIIHFEARRSTLVRWPCCFILFIFFYCVTKLSGEYPGRGYCTLGQSLFPFLCCLNGLNLHKIAKFGWRSSKSVAIRWFVSEICISISAPPMDNSFFHNITGVLPGLGAPD